jgi:hypothetical protein
VIGALWKSFGAKAGERWATTVFTPAFLFWAAGVVSAMWDRGGAEAFTRLADWFNRQPPVTQATIAILALLGVVASGFAVETLTLAFTRMLEGYWPSWLNGLRRRLVRRREPSAQEEARWQELAALIDARTATAEQTWEQIALDLHLRRIPASPERRMPTRLGNTLGAAENLPEIKYGLNAVRCWPRLWLVLPDSTKTELARARVDLDTAITASLWGLLFVGWTFWAWWSAPVGLIASYLSYRRAVAIAEDYSDLMEATFDVHRRELYRAAGWPLPDNPDEERRLGPQLVEYLERGTAPTNVRFTS